MDINLENLCYYGTYKKVKKGHIFYSSGDEVNGKCYLVLSGKLEIKKTFDMDNAFIQEIEKGGVAGIVELFSEDEKRLTGLKAIQDSGTYEWDIHGLREIASSNLEFSLYIIKNLSTVLRGLDFEYKELVLKTETE